MPAIRSPVTIAQSPMISEAQMYRREVEINGTPLSFETGKYAKQADGSVIVRMGDSVVLVTACASPNPREGIDFLPLTVDYKEYTYASGRIPGRLLQARRQAVRKGSADQPRDRSPDPAAVPRGLAQRVADYRARAVGRRELRPGRARDQRRLGGAGAVEHSVPEDDRRRARRQGRRPVRHQPDLRAAEEELARPRDRGQQGRAS